jgi:ribose 5-phosphate isomerase B
MKIAVGADHAGFAMKQVLVQKLRDEGHEVADLGTTSTESTDYPDFAAAVGHAVAQGKAEKGLLVCSSGVGMSIAANKIKGIRAALGTNEEEVMFSRAHNDANILALGAKFTPEQQASKMLEVFLQTPFEGGRHARRVAKIAHLEETE